MIYVAQTLLYNGSEVQTGGDGNVFIGYFGNQAVSLRAPFRGTLVAPNAQVELTTQAAPYAGAFIGSSVQVDPNNRIVGIGAVLPGAGGAGISPTLDCVVQLGSKQLGAVFGYTNTTGSNVELRAGAHNFFSSGPTDVGQPILFVPGAVPIASYRTFPSNRYLTYTLGQQSVVASASSRACPASLASALTQLFGPSADATTVVQHGVSAITSPQFANWVSAAKTALSPLTPMETAQFDLISLVSANADLLTPGASLTAAQQARVPGFQAAILSNPFVVAIRLAGDAMRSSVSRATCTVLDSINASQAFQPVFYARPQIGSLYAQTAAIITSPSETAVNRAVAGVAENPSTAAALFAAPGLFLAAYQPLATLESLQLPGTIPTHGSVGDVLGGALTGGVIGAGAGAAIGGPIGAVVGGAIGAIGGGVIGGVDPGLLDQGAPCDEHCGNSGQCMSGDVCAGGCCTDGPQGVSINFLNGTQCAGGAQSCTSDDHCGPNANFYCLNGCCASQTLVRSCSGATCTTSADCNAGDTCNYGCCVGPCGFGGIECSTYSTASCGAQDAGGNTCPVGWTCNDGCCAAPVEPPPR